MAIQRAYSVGWAIGELVTSTQLNQMDKNGSYGIDKRDGFGDVFASVLQPTGAGRVLRMVQTGDDSNSTIEVTAGQIVRIPALTAARKYTVATSGATGGDQIFFYIEGTGHSPSGYVDIANSVGTGLFRLGMTRGFYATGVAGWNDSAQGDSCALAFISAPSGVGTGGLGWKLMSGGAPGMRSIDFTSVAATEWLCPPGVHSVLLYGYGGGGGGASGQAGSGTAQTAIGAGGGGGGAWPRWYRVEVQPGTIYEVLCGDGGAGAQASYSAGSAGGDSIFREKATGNVLATWRGADYGSTAGTMAQNVLCEPFAFGGGSVRNPYTTERSFVATGFVKDNNFLGVFANLRPATSGGFGTTVLSATTRGQDGHSSSEGYSGGAAGAQGTTDGDYYGGGGGGGGGAGPAGNGGAGGAGGNGTATSGASGTAGTNGSSAAANSGAGGGGGGAGGMGYSGGGSAGLGGSGGSGKVTLVFIK